MSRATLRFGGFELDAAERRLVSGGEAISLGPRAFDVLATLLERPGQLVTKDELFARVWPRLVVEENNLQVQISTLRKVLGPHAIETVAGSGYRFRGEVVSSTAVEAAAPRHNLPPPLSSFVGREQDVAALAEQLKASALVTVVGVGGLGKSRLALRAAEAVKDGYADGAWWVDLASIADASTVPHAVAGALGVAEGHSALDSLADHVAGRRLLLILDNCEHVLAACAALAAHLLRRAPGLAILATSREAMRIFAETVYSLSPLPLPGADAAADDALACGSVRLFVDRATAANPSFRVGVGEIPLVVEICRRLDGIPLAIELAAARVRVLSLSAIEQRLAGRFALLTRGDRTALPRQQTLRAMIDWSHELLEPHERVLFARLAVFAAGASLEGAEAVAAGDPIDRADVLDLMGRLVDKSLVVHDAARGRYRMLDTIREYALERLARSEEEAAVCDRHLAHFLALGRHAEPELRGADWVACMARLNLERDNFLAAHAWCERSGRAEDGLLLVDALRMWLSRSSLELGARLAREALARPGARARTRARCLGAFSLAAIAYYAGHNDEAIAHAEESLAIAREIGDPAKTVDALVVLGIARSAVGDQRAARESLAEALARSRGLKDSVRITDALCNLAEAYTLDGEPSLAIPLYQETIELVRATGNHHALGVNTCNLARNHLLAGSRSAAVPLLRDVASTLDPSMPEQTVQLLLVACAGLAVIGGDPERAARLYGLAEADLAHRHATREPGEEHFLSPLLERARREIDPAVFETAERAGRALSYEEAMSEIKAWLSTQS